MSNNVTAFKARLKHNTINPKRAEEQPAPKTKTSAAHALSKKIDELVVKNTPKLLPSLW